MPVLLVKAASTSSSAFLSEAAAKTVMVLSCASAGVGGRARAMPSATAARNGSVRLRILALLELPPRLRDVAPRSGTWSGHRFVRKRPTRKRRSGAAARLRRAMGRGGRVAGSYSKAKVCVDYPAVPAPLSARPREGHPATAKARLRASVTRYASRGPRCGDPAFGLDSRLRGNERRSFVRLPRLGPARSLPTAG